MSDFDKEAEREKLREQLAREEEAREATQHMSDLLLKGATMTNKHCDDCGDPVFRYQGQEFCPTCGQEMGTVDDADGGDAEGADAGSAVAEGTDGEPRGGQTADAHAADADGGTADRGGVAADAASGSRPVGVESRDPSATSREPSAGASPTPGDAAGDDLEAARASLVRKLTTLARQAEATDDVGRSRDLLAAAREAAEALAAVDGVRH